MTPSARFLFGGFAVLSLLLGSASATDCKTINSIAYCKEVDTLGYGGMKNSGEYDEVVDMDASACKCTTKKKAFSGPMGALNEELSIHFRGPVRLKQVAVYVMSKTAKAKREHLRRHAHGHMHRRNVKVETVTRATTIYTTVDPSEPTPRNDGPPAPKIQKEETPTSSKAPKESPKDTPKDDTPSTSGGWDRVAYYSSSPKTAQGLVFLNHRGGAGSGVFDPCLGLSLSYANSDMSSGCSSPEILDDIMVGSGIEFVIMSDKKCEGNDCGYYRPGIPAYHGWQGEQKAFAFELSMPRDTPGGPSSDLPATWLLNANVPRVAQFGIRNDKCTSWPTSGEFDIFEALPGTDADPAKDMMKTHIHCAPGGPCGGNRDYFARPLQKTIKFIAILNGPNAYVTKLDDSFSFDKVLPEKVLNECKNTQNIFTP